MLHWYRNFSYVSFQVKLIWVKYRYFEDKLLNVSFITFRGDWINAGQFSFFSQISQLNNLIFFTFLCISHLKVPPIFFL
jgi:hypothetical protein